MRCAVGLALVILWVVVAPRIHAAESTAVAIADLAGTKARWGTRQQSFVAVKETGLRVPLSLPLGRVQVDVVLRFNGRGESWLSREVHGMISQNRQTAILEALGPETPLTFEVVSRGEQTDLDLKFGTLTEAMKREFLKLQAQQLANGDATPKDADLTGGDELDDDLELAGEEPTIDAQASLLPMVLLESIEVTSLSGAVLVTEVGSDRITYAPGERGTLLYTLENLAPNAVSGTVTALLTEGLGERTEIANASITLQAGERLRKEVPFAVGDALWGRGFLVQLTSPTGNDLAAHAVSVVSNPWMVAMHGRGTAMSGSERWTPEQAQAEAERLAQENMANYNNVYEAFAWAACDMSELTPDDNQPFYSGQTQYAKKRKSLQVLHQVFKKYGIGAITYGKACASGLPGLEYSLAHPEQMNIFGLSGFAHERIDVDVIDRMLEGRYRQHGYHEDFWQMWISCWSHYGNHAVTNFGTDEIIRSAKLMGWSGVRYDGAWQVWQDPAATARLLDHHERRIRAALPDFVVGYNHCGPRHNTAAGAFSDIEMAAMAHNGGLVMSEYYRNLRGPVRTNIAHLQNVGDVVRLHGGYFLCIYDDDSPWNAALVMAAGARPMGGGGLRKFATRFSQYMLDPALRRLQVPQRVVQAEGDLGFRWDAFVYERWMSAEKSQLILQLVNVSDKTQIGDAYTPPSNLNAPQRDMVFTLSLPPGVQAESVFATGDTERFTPMAARLDGNRLRVPELRLWTQVVVELSRTAGSPTLSNLCEATIDFTKDPAGDAAGERAALSIGAALGDEAIDAINQARVKITPELLRGVLALGLPPDTAPGDKAYQPADFADHRAGRDVAWAGDDKSPPIRLLRDGVLNIHYGRGVFSHRNRLGQAFSLLPGAVVTDSPLRGATRALSADNSCAMADWPSREALSTLDLVVLDNIPMPALTLQQRRDLADFVRAGGGLLVLGGWYALSKGEYEGTFVEEVLPVRTKQATYLQRRRDRGAKLLFDPVCEALLKIVLPPQPGALEWINHIEVRDNATVLARTGDAPVLVAGTSGKGRVLVWAGSHSGQPEMPWWESAWWPKLAAATLRYLAPAAGEVAPPDPVLQQKVTAAIANLEEGDLAEEDEELGAKAKKLRLILSLNTEGGALFAANYLLTNPDSVEPAAIAGLVDAILPHIAATSEWASVVRPHLRMPPVGYSTLVAEVAAAAVDTMSYEAVMKWEGVGQITRLRCLAATRDPKALPYLRKLNGELNLREQKLDELLAARASHYETRDQYTSRLVRPFVTYALLRCGDRSHETVYRFAKACLDLPYYHWRQHWVLRNHQGAAQEAHKAGTSAKGPELAIRRCERAIKDMARAMEQTAHWFKPDVLGQDAGTLGAVGQALADADCRKSLPLALRYLQLSQTADLPALAMLKRAKLKEIARTYAARQAE